MPSGPRRRSPCRSAPSAAVRRSAASASRAGWLPSPVKQPVAGCLPLLCETIGGRFIALPSPSASTATRPARSSPGTVAGETATQIPRATSATATTGASRGPCGRTFSAKITTATTAIQKRLITPSTKSTAISAPEQPTQSRPCARPLRNALPCGGAAAAAQAQPLERRQLVDARRDDHAARRVRAARDPRRAARCRASPRAGRGRRPATP